MRRSNIFVIKVGLALIVLIFLCLTGLFLLHTWEKHTGTVSSYGDGTPEEELVYYNGGWYRPRKGLETILVIGVDQASEDSALYREEHYEQSDFLMLLVIDQEAGHCTSIHINRDTMAEIRVLDDDTNEHLGTITGQLSLAHSYGNRPEARCKNTADAVSGLLYGIPIDHYLSLSMDGVAILNDLAGGVTLEVMDDLTGLDAALIQGETVTLRGQQALTYVRARQGLDDPTNLHRMERQRQYLEALQDQLTTHLEMDEEFITSALLELNDYMVSDCTIQQLDELVDMLWACASIDYLTLEGESDDSGKYVEYYLNDSAARELVMGLFYEQTEID